MRLYKCDACKKVVSNRSEMRAFTIRFTTLDSNPAIYIDERPANVEHERNGEYCLDCAAIFWNSMLDISKNLTKKEKETNG